MKRKISILILLAFTLTTGSLVAQEVDANKSFKRLFNSTDVGLLVGASSNEQKAPFSFMNVTSYHLTKQFAVGLGIGADFYKETYIPIVADLRYYFRTTKFSPYAYFQAGYSISAEDEIHQDIYYSLSSIWPGPSRQSVSPKGGLMINPGIGVRNMFSEHFGVTFSIGYRYQKLNYESNSDSRLEIEYNRLSFKFGVIFR